MTDASESNGRAQADALRTLVDTYQALQKERIAIGNRADAIRRGVDTGDAELFDSIENRLKGLESEVSDTFGNELEEYAIAKWLLSIRGVGDVLAAKTIAFVGDIRNFETASSLWMYVGFGLQKRCADESCDTLFGDLDTVCPQCGGKNSANRVQRRRAGEKINYSPEAKRHFRVMAETFLRTGSPYRSIYDSAYAYYIENRPDWSRCATCEAPIRECTMADVHGTPRFRSKKGQGWQTGHIDAAAKRKMIKVFLANLFEAWRRIEGLPIRQLYVHGVLGHRNRYRPEDFTDYELAAPKWIEQP